MPDDISPDRSSIRRPFPILRTFDAAAIALSPVSVAIAAVASVLIYVSWWLVGCQTPFDQSSYSLSDTTKRWLPTGNSVAKAEFLTYETLIRPWTSVTYPASLILKTSNSWSERFTGLIQLLLAIGIWSLAGTILCRRSATLFVGNDESTFRRAIQYSLVRYRASATAPVIPLFTALLPGLFLAGIGFVGRLPFLGSLWLMIASPVAMILGFAVAFLLLVTAIGWPLMVAAVATDDCDSFGGLSRAYSGLTGRPWHALVYGLISILIGIVLIVVVNLLIATAFSCTISCTGFGSGDEQAHSSLLAPLTIVSHIALSGVGVSFFWSASTVIYLLLRLEVDRVPLDRLALDDDARPARDPLPVVGVPATDAWKKSNGQASSGSE